jgi:hypothetical protein
MKHCCRMWILLGSLACAVAVAAQGGPIAPEKGKLRVMQGGTKVADEEFSIAPRSGGWLTTGNVQINIPGGPSARLSSRLYLNAQGLPERYEWTLAAEGSKRAGSVQFEGGTASSEVRVDDSQPFAEQFFFDSPRVVILDNNFYHHYAILARLYDWKQKGAQTFRVFIPQDRTPGDVLVESLGEQDSDKGKVEHLRVRTTDLELDLFVNRSGLVRLVVPAANVVVEHN